MEENFAANFGGAILAGGQSERMGFNKALLEIDGEPLIAKVARVLNETGVGNFQIVGGDSATFTSLGYSCLSDEYPGEGPLGGIITALNYFKSQGKKHVLIVACDLPNISKNFINEMFLKSIEEPESILVPVVEEHLQWMHALWPTDVLPVLLKSFSSSNRAPWRATEDLQILKIEGADPHVLFDIDEPDDLTRILQSGAFWKEDSTES